MTSIADVQRALLKKNFPVVADGIWGRLSTEAMRNFQTAVGLPITGHPDEASVKALLPQAQVAPTPVWYSELLRFKGLREGAGASDNPILIGWAKALGGFVARFFQHDSTAWCGLATAHAVSATLPREPLPANPLGALEWRRFGVPLKEPALGAILVFTRPGAPGAGHVGLYAGEDESRYYVLAGNQGDSVSIVPIQKSRCVAIRWPKTVALPAPVRIRLQSAQAASTNEA